MDTLDAWASRGGPGSQQRNRFQTPANQRSRLVEQNHTSVCRRIKRQVEIPKPLAVETLLDCSILGTVFISALYCIAGIAGIAGLQSCDERKAQHPARDGPCPGVAGRSAADGSVERGSGPAGAYRPSRTSRPSRRHVAALRDDARACRSQHKQRLGSEAPVKNILDAGPIIAAH